MAEVKLENAPKGVQTYYDKGVTALKHSNFDYAMDMFETVLLQEPRLLLVRKLLRTAAMKNAQKTPSGKLIKAKTAGRLLKAYTILKTNPMRTIEITENLLRIDPLNFKFSKLQCNAAEAANLPEIAIQTLEILKNHSAPTPAVLTPLARLYQEAEQFDSEYACRKTLARLSPKDATAARELKNSAARLTMGKAGWQKSATYRDMVYTDEPQPQKEEQNIDQLLLQIETDPKNMEYLQSLADYQLENKAYDDARQTLEKCIKISDHPTPRIEEKLYKVQELCITTQLALAENSHNPEGIARLHKLLIELRIKNTTRQVERYPNDLQLKFEYGKLLFESNNLTDSIQQFQLALRNPQHRTKALIYLAKAFNKKQQHSIAREQLEAALKEEPVMNETRKEILYELGLSCTETGDNEQADSYLKEIYSIDIGYKDVAARVENSVNL